MEKGGRNRLAHFRRDNEKVSRTRKRKDVNGGERIKKKAKENGAEGEGGVGKKGDARGEGDRIYSRVAPWLLVPGFLGLPEGRYEFPVLLPGTNSCVSSTYFRVRAHVCPCVRGYTCKQAHTRVFASGARDISMYPDVTDASPHFV